MSLLFTLQTDLCLLVVCHYTCCYSNSVAGLVVDKF
jgi:hypothetical protein